MNNDDGQGRVVSSHIVLLKYWHQIVETGFNVCAMSLLYFVNKATKVMESQKEGISGSDGRLSVF